MLVNPPVDRLGSSHAIVSGRARGYEVASFSGPLSLKSVVRGSAVWETDAGRFALHPGSAFVVNGGEEYSMSIDALQPVETFCLFFSSGFVEDACRAVATGSAGLLDREPETSMPFIERFHDGDVGVAMAAAHRAFHDGLPLEPVIVSAASALAATQSRLNERVARLPALRRATRDELRCRVARASDFIHANLAKPVRLADLAEAACLSPFHLHRAFVSIHGVTPHRYMTSLRLRRARSLLQSSEMGILDVALECGFESVTSFTTLFRRAWGAPPARFRKIREETGGSER